MTTRAPTILLVSPALDSGGGWETFARITAEGLHAQGYTVTSLVAKQTAHPLPQRTGLPQPLAPVESRTARWRTAWAIARAVRALKPDIIHVLAEPYALAMPLAARLTRLPPWVMNLHGTYTILPFSKPQTRRLLCQIYATADALICCSDYTRNKTLNGIAEFCGSDAKEKAAKKIRMFRFGIEPGTFIPETKNAEKRLLFVGGVKPRKGVLELIRGCGELKRRSTVPFRLDVVGALKPDGPYARQLQDAITEEGLAENVHLRGHVSDAELDALYAQADAFVMLSQSIEMDYEGFGLVFLEAASRGIPVIGSIDSGCREALKEGVSGYAVPAKQPGIVADRMRDILEHRRIARTDCRAWADEHTIERQTDRFVEVYEEVLQP